MKKINIQEVLEKTSDLTQEKKVGYVAIIGRPNVGKSSFINSLLGEKVSITTNTPQTTRKKILAIYNDDESQIVFFDNPGIHKSEKIFNKEINNEAIHSIKDADLILYFIDASRQSGQEENYIQEILEIANKKVINVYTKSDLPQKIDVPNGAIKISSVDNSGFEILIGKIKENLEVGNIFFPEEYYTKQSLDFRISEIIREKLFSYTKEELPHSTYVKIEEIQDTKDIFKIIAYIYTETDSQKYIVIGKSGQLIQKIGKEARVELEELLDKKVFLALRVKVNKKWTKNEKLVKDIFT